jgi:hypothetical protein
LQSTAVVLAPARVLQPVQSKAASGPKVVPSSLLSVRAASGHARYTRFIFRFLKRPQIEPRPDGADLTKHPEMDKMYECKNEPTREPTISV